MNTPSTPSPGNTSGDLLTERRLALQGASNFRDLGGYRTADGRRVKWKHVFRSDSLAKLTDADMDVVSGLDLRHLFDLRDKSERAPSPNRELPSARLQVHHLDVYPYRNDEMMGGIGAGKIAAPEAYAWVHELYLRFLDEPAFSRLLHTLTTPAPFPVLIHCTSGKDRTGFACALVLSALGVPRETILADFILSNEFRKDIRHLFGEKVEATLLHTLSGVQQSYLEGVFAQIDANWGSVDAYLRQGLGLSEQAQRHLQETLLED